MYMTKQLNRSEMTVAMASGPLAEFAKARPGLAELVLQGVTKYVGADGVGYALKASRAAMDDDEPAPVAPSPPTPAPAPPPPADPIRSYLDDARRASADAPEDEHRSYRPDPPRTSTGSHAVDTRSDDSIEGYIRSAGGIVERYTPEVETEEPERDDVMADYIEACGGPENTRGLSLAEYLSHARGDQ